MERSGNPDRNKIGIGQACEFHDPHPIDELWQQAPGDLEAQTRLADASGTRQGDEAAGGGEAEDLLERDGAADQFGNRLRQVRRWTGRSGLKDDGRACNRLRLRICRDRAYHAGELVASSGDRADQAAIRREGVAQCRDLDVQVVLFDDLVRSDTLDQRVFAHHSPRRLDQRHQHIEGAPAEMDRSTIGKELAAVRQNPETAELHCRRRFG